MLNQFLSIAYHQDTADSSNNDEDEDEFDNIELEVLKSPSAKSAVHVETAVEINNESTVRRSLSIKSKLSLPSVKEPRLSVKPNKKHHSHPKRIVSKNLLFSSLIAHYVISDLKIHLSNSRRYCNLS